jgi:asparagine synthase (glutamine-hydrolysing)
MPYSLHEDWDLKEKFSKFIVNSCQVYAWFGFEYRLPFYDKEFLDFFRDMPFALKENKVLYDTCLREGIFREMELNFEREIQAGRRLQQKVRMRSKIKHLLPSILLPSSLPRERDFICYHEATERLVKDMASRGWKIRPCGSSYNSLIIQWYILYLRQKYPGR